VGAGLDSVARVHTAAELAGLLRQLRRRDARQRGAPELTFRELAARTGWSHAAVGEYLTGRKLPPTDRFEVLVRVLGATVAEQGALTAARDRVEESRRTATLTRTAVPGVPVPRELPGDVPAFTGRTEQLAVLEEAFAATEQTAVVISGVSGGVGKTALALHFAHRVAARFPDGQLYVDLRGHDAERPRPPADALARFLRSLGVNGTDIPIDVDERSARYRTLLADRRMLIVLDNAHSADQVRPLLPSSSSCLVVATSRDDLAGLVARDGARRIDLDVLTQPEALALLGTLIGPRVAADPDAVARIAAYCGRLPLALGVAAQLAVARAGVSLPDLAAELRDLIGRRERLDGSDGRVAVSTVFSWSVGHLPAEAARAVELLGLHPGDDFDGYVVAALAGTGLAEADRLVEALAQANLVTRSGGRYGVHDLVRTYAVELAAARLGPGEAKAALTRLYDHYLRAAGQAMDVLYPRRHFREVSGAPIGLSPDLSEPQRALTWLDAERANLVAAGVHAAGQPWSDHGVRLSSAVWQYLDERAHYADALTLHTAAARDGDGDVLTNLGIVYYRLGVMAEAVDLLRKAVTRQRETGDRRGEARALANVGVVYDRMGNYSESLECCREALAAYREIGDAYHERIQLLNLGVLHVRQGRDDQGEKYLLEAVAAARGAGDASIEGYARVNLGGFYERAGRYAEGLDHLVQALAICRELGDRDTEGHIVDSLGRVYLGLGRIPEALEHLGRSLTIGRELGDRGVEAKALNSLGEALRTMGDPEPARVRHEAALALAEETDDRFECARARDGIAHVLFQRGELALARDLWRQALDGYRDLGVPETERVRDRLATLDGVA
jgi:tetratricopeptide (TPR) repeat protein